MELLPACGSGGLGLLAVIFLGGGRSNMRFNKLCEGTGTDPGAGTGTDPGAGTGTDSGAGTGANIDTGTRAEAGPANGSGTGCFMPWS